MRLASSPPTTLDSADDPKAGVRRGAHHNRQKTPGAKPIVPVPPPLTAATPQSAARFTRQQKKPQRNWSSRQGCATSWIGSGDGADDKEKANAGGGGMADSRSRA